MTIDELLNFNLIFESDHIKFIELEKNYFYTLSVWKINTEDYAEAVFKFKSHRQHERITEWRQIKG